MQTTGYLHGSVRLRSNRAEPYWELRYRLPDGTDSKKTLGKAWTKKSRPPEGYLTKAQAEVKGQQFLDDNATSVPTSRKMFRRACEDFLTSCQRERNLRGSTLYNYRRIALILCQRWGERTVDSFTEADLLALRQKMIDEGRKPQTLNQHRLIVRGALGKGSVAECWPWAAIKVESKGKLHFYTSEQIVLLKEAAQDDRDRAIFTLATEAGPRMSEIRALKIRNVDFDAGVIRIEDGYTSTGGHAGTKGHKTRSVPMSENVRHALKPFCEERPLFTHDEPTLVFEEAEGSNLPLNDNALWRRFKRAVKRAGLPEIRFHDLRHTFGTQLMASGKVDIYTLKILMGHEDIATTERYLHYRPNPHMAATISGLFQSDNGVVVPT